MLSLWCLAFSPGLHQRLLCFPSWLLTDHFLFCLATYWTYLPVSHFNPPFLSNSSPPPLDFTLASSGTLGGAAVCLFLTTSPSTATQRRQCVMRS